jgi:HSP20 family molecular chaperone IbpA
VPVDADKVTANLKNGILQMKMPKATKGKTIEIKPKAA